MDSRLYRLTRQQSRAVQDTPPAAMTISPPAPHASTSTSSVNTYNSLYSDMDDDEDDDDDDCLSSTEQNFGAVPASLPPCYDSLGVPADLTLRPSDPYTFGRLFPCMDRLAIRHDDASIDGNMNLRVEMVVTSGSSSSSHYSAAQQHQPRRRRQATLQARLRLASVVVVVVGRRLLRGTGLLPLRLGRAALRQDALLPPVVVVVGGVVGLGDVAKVGVLALLPQVPRLAQLLGNDTTQPARPQQPPVSLRVPTDTIKLEFSNYARVDVRRRGPKRYEFDWWGHSYAWRRSVDKTLNTVSFHLVRDGRGDPVAHIVPEVRSPTQVDEEDRAGGWIPPCYMWISDPSVVEAVTDVADIIVATGLMALVDDCIRDRWQVKNPAPPSPDRPRTSAETGRSRSGVRAFFSRRSSAQHSHSPLRAGRPVAVY
ncbi:hypothetical protein HIM_07561 [Hirsutella minnesotensis 3608]|uniref:Uncharacterized protein n=1 Tax=Hirsutella minnesotensis 3608 TaxID=1043627 RepID=A0A0F8A455_9HYPO|nr:hypothetical protein HIM_07561 [Hirsutella minnesotensis 3608]